jgi:hypothetical protein
MSLVKQVVNPLRGLQIPNSAIKKTCKEMPAEELNGGIVLMAIHVLDPAGAFGGITKHCMEQCRTALAGLRSR